MGNQSFGQGVLRTGLAMANRNRFYAQQANQQVGLNNLITTVGTSAQTLGDASLAAEQERQRKAAAATLGGQLGLTPDQSQQLPVSTLAERAWALQNRGYVSPVDQAKILSEGKQGDYYASEAELNRAKASGKVQSDANPLWTVTPELKPFAGNADTVPYNSVPGIVSAANRDALRRHIEEQYHGTATLGQDANGNDIIVPINQKTIAPIASTINNRNAVAGAGARNDATISSRNQIAAARDVMLQNIVNKRIDARSADVQSRLDQMNRALGITDETKRYVARLGYEGNIAGGGLRSGLLPPDVTEEAFRAAKRAGDAAVANPSGASGSPPPTAAPAGPTATGKNGEKYVLQGDQWVLVK